MSWQVVFAIKKWQQPHLFVLFAAEHCIANDYNITNWPTVYFTKHPNFQINLQQQGKGANTSVSGTVPLRSTHRRQSVR